MSSTTRSYRNAEQKAHCSVAQRGRSPTRPSCRAGGPASNPPEGRNMASFPECSQLSLNPHNLEPQHKIRCQQRPFQPNSRSGRDKRGEGSSCGHGRRGTHRLFGACGEASWSGAPVDAYSLQCSRNEASLQTCQNQGGHVLLGGNMVQRSMAQ